MELRCLPTETPTPASSCSEDPLYDNCMPHGQRDRDRARVTGLPAPNDPPPGLAPAVAELPRLSEGRGAGRPPDHSYCSWGGPGRQSWDRGLGLGINTGGGGGRGGGGGGVGRGGAGRREGVGDREEREEGTEAGRRREHSPSVEPSGVEHESALSVYDNLHAVTPDTDDEQVEVFLEIVAMETGYHDPLGQRMRLRLAGRLLDQEDGRVSAGESSSWSSCEIVLACSSASNGPDPDQDDQEDQEHQDPEPVDQDEPCGPQLHPPLLSAGLPHPNDPSPPAPQAQVPPEVSPQPGDPGEAGSAPRLPPPLPLADPSASALRSLLTSLQQQIVRQREEYERHIHSLEERNEELQGEVLGLRANLAQQRRWYSVVQAKILESEQARATADARNGALQKEMEQFFDTFGELNNEAKKTERIVRSF